MGRTHGWPSDEKSEAVDMSFGPRYCEQCNYEADDGYHLDMHTYAEHEQDIDSIEIDEESFQSVDENNSLKCQFCDERFNAKKDLMLHKKLKHNENVSVCWKFPSEKCGYNDDTCWFIHTLTQTKEFKCNLCNKTFLNQSESLTHKKQNHKQLVPSCNNFKQGACKFTDSECWFNHSNISEVNNHSEVMEIKETKEMIHNIFDMMEKFTEQMTKLKQLNNLI